MRILKPIFFLAILIFFCGDILAYGPPNYKPDGPHPRIFLTQTVLSTLKAKIAANDSDWLALKAKADVLLTYAVPSYHRTNIPTNSINYAYEGFGWLEAAQVLGIAYQVTGNTAYATKLEEVANVMISAGVTPITVDSGYPSRSVGFAAALIYDWLYDYLNSTTKADLLSTINAYYTSFTTDSLWYATTGTAYNNFFGGHLLGFGTCAIATYGDSATAITMLSDIRLRWNNAVIPAFASGGYTGGAVIESYNYGPGHLIRLLEYGVALQTATGEDIYSAYGAKLADNLLYNLKPNRWQSTDDGDMPGTYTGVMPSSLSLVLSGFIPGDSGDYMAFFYNNFAPTIYTDATNTIQRSDPFTRFLFKLPRPQTDYRLTKPLVFRSAGDERVFIRSDWTDNAIWSSYRAGNLKYTDHQASTAGHIAIQRGGDYLLVNSAQWKGDSGVAGTPKNFNTASKWSNTLYFTDGGAYLYYGGLTGQYAGGQMSTFPDANAVLSYETTSDYTYVKADHTNAYDIRANSRNPTTRSLRYFYRNFVKVGDKTFVVYDRIKALQTGFTKKLYWHLNKQGQPVAVDTKTTSSTVGNSKLFIKSIYPTTSTVTFDQDISDSGGATTPRVEIADSVASTDFNPITVLVADSKSATIPLTVLVLSNDGKMVGTYINNASKPSVVLFSANQNGGDVTVSNGEIISYNLPAPVSNSLQHILVHLPPNTDFTALPQTSANGVVTFKLKAGAFPIEGKVYRASEQGVIRLGQTSKPPEPPKWQ